MKNLLLVLLSLSLSSIAYSAAAPSAAMTGKAGLTESYRNDLKNIIDRLKTAKASNKTSAVRTVMKDIMAEFDLGSSNRDTLVDAMADALTSESNHAFKEVFLSLIALKDPKLTENQSREDSASHGENVDSAGKLAVLSLALGKTVENADAAEALNNVCSKLFKDSTLKGEELAKWKSVLDEAIRLRKDNPSLSVESAFAQALTTVTNKSGPELQALLRELKECT